jgi:hypothetical protein
MTTSITLHPELTGSDKVRKPCEMITPMSSSRPKSARLAGRQGSCGDRRRAAGPAAGGPYDVIACAEARSIDALGRLVVSRIQAINDVTRTLTCSVVHL